MPLGLACILCLRTSTLPFISVFFSFFSFLCVLGVLLLFYFIFSLSFSVCLCVLRDGISLPCSLRELREEKWRLPTHTHIYKYINIYLLHTGFSYSPMPVEQRHNVGTTATTTTTTDNSSGIATAAVFTSPPDANEQLALLASLRFGRQRVHAWLHNTEKMLQQTADAKWMCAWITSA